MNPNDEALRETSVSSELIFDGKVVHLYLDNILLPDGKPATREYLRHVGAVAVLPLFAAVAAWFSVFPPSALVSSCISFCPSGDCMTRCTICGSFLTCCNTCCMSTRHHPFCFIQGSI